jgi:hypothetical protein
METLVIDAGTTMVGIYAVEAGTYVPYTMSEIIAVAVPRIAAAREVITYNGRRYDLLELGRLAGMSCNLPLTGIHTDMEVICWSDRINGKCLLDTYLMHFDVQTTFPSTYEGSNECDCHMTFKLWELWKQGKLKVLDGHNVPRGDGDRVHQ